MLQLAAWLSAVAVWLVCLVLPLLLVCRAMVLCQRKRPVLGWCLSVVCCPPGLLLVWGVATVAGQAWGNSCVVLRGSCSLRCLSPWVVLVPRVCWGVVASSPESVAQSLGAVGWHGGGCPQTSDLLGGGLLEDSTRMFQTPSVSSKSSLSPGPSNIAFSSVADNGAPL